jgi:arabinofuranosyltransferase
VRDAHHSWDVDPFVDLLRAIEIISGADSVPARAIEAARAGRTRPVVLVPAVGTYGWYAGASLHVLDIYGLGDPLLSRLPAVRPDPLLGRFAPRLAGLGWRQGHFIRRIPEGYVATLLSGENRLHDVDLASYWADVALATRAPLLSPGRAAAIARLVRGQSDPRLVRARERIAAASAAR